MVHVHNGAAALAALLLAGCSNELTYPPFNEDAIVNGDSARAPFDLAGREFPEFDLSVEVFDLGGHDLARPRRDLAVPADLAIPDLAPPADIAQPLTCEACLSTADCPMGRVCNLVIGKCTPICAMNGDCTPFTCNPMTFFCSCIPPGPGVLCSTCLRDTDCASSFCGPANQCNTLCTSDTDCGGRTCDLLTNSCMCP
jgi:hypothetical protein